MTSIGETLRRERLQQGLDLQQLSHTTKIGTRMLQAMEQNDFSKLPGGVFTRSFIKQYAVALGLSPTALDEQLSHLQTDPDEPSKSGPRKDVIPEHSHYSLSDYNSSRNSGSMLMSIAWVAIAVLVGGAVYYLMNRPPSTPADAAKPAAAQVPVKASAPPAAASAPPPAAAEIANNQSPVIVSVTVTEDSWVSLTADGNRQFAGEMKRGEKRTIGGQAKVRLVTGNAGALEVSLNGKQVDPIGPKGKVRLVEFTTGGTHVVPRTPPKRPPLR